MSHVEALLLLIQVKISDQSVSALQFRLIEMTTDKRQKQRENLSDLDGDFHTNILITEAV